MRTPTLDSLSVPVRRGVALTILSFALVAGLAGCDGAGPTDPGVDPSMDPTPLTLYQPTVPTAVARTSTELPWRPVLPVRPPGGSRAAGTAESEAR